MDCCKPLVAGKTCKSILNPFCRIDFNAKIWVCPFCFQRNHFPPHYSEVSENNLPAELIPNYTTIEYALPRAPAGPLEDADGQIWTQVPSRSNAQAPQPQQRAHGRARCGPRAAGAVFLL